MPFKISYNAPVTLSFSIACFVVMLLSYPLPWLTAGFFTLPGSGDFDFSSFLCYVRLLTYPIGHGGFQHLFGNLCFLLLLGPILEEKYGAKLLIIMMIITALVTGIVNITFSSHGLLGASGIVFMFILLSSFANYKKGAIPLTFILIVLIFMTREAASSLTNNNISEMGHILGGLCGAVFGFYRDSLKKAVQHF